MIYLDAVPNLVKLFWMPKTNWWHDWANESFFTNCSLVNAAFCWLIWFYVVIAFIKPATGFIWVPFKMLWHFIADSDTRCPVTKFIVNGGLKTFFVEYFAGMDSW